MPRSLDYLRPDDRTARSLAATVIDSRRQAVLVVDGRLDKLPVIVANAAAQNYLTDESNPGPLRDISLFALLASGSASVAQTMFGTLSDSEPVIEEVLFWRSGSHETGIRTEMRLISPAHEERYIKLSFMPFTARIDTASTLEHSEWLKLSMKMAHMHAWRWDKIEDQFSFATAEDPPVDLPGEFPDMPAFMARVHPDDQKHVVRDLHKAVESRCEVRGEFRLKAKNGAYRTFANVARPVFDSAGTVVGLVGVTQDVTPRVESDSQLRRSEQLLRATTTNTADTLILVDTDLKVRFVNKPLAGRSIDRLLGTEIWTAAPEEAQGSVLAKLREVLATGEAANYEFDYRGAEGKPQYYENSAVIVRDKGVVTGISISVRNITERKRLEKEILEASNRERQAIGRDLHDGLGQELTGVALMLRGLAMRLQRQWPDVVDSVNEIVGLVNQSIETTRSLARGLFPVRTDSGGLPFALAALATRSREMYGFEVNFRAEVLPESTLGETPASHLYRVAQEAITNVARHGQASKVDIVLIADKNRIVLEISDNGVGIGGSQETETGMGLRIMRYRAGMIGAKFEIDANKPRGTVVRVISEQPSGKSAPHSTPAT